MSGVCHVDGSCPFACSEASEIAQNCGWWFVIAVRPSGINEHLATFDNFEDAEWYGTTQAL